MATRRGARERARAGEEPQARPPRGLLDVPVRSTSLVKMASGSPKFLGQLAVITGGGQVLCFEDGAMRVPPAH